MLNRLIIALGVVFAVMPSFAAQYKEVTHMQTLTVDLSTKDPNVISLKNDRIKQYSAVKGLVSASIDQDSGILSLKPTIMHYDKPFSLIVFTEKGFVDTIVAKTKTNVSSKITENIVALKFNESALKIKNILNASYNRGINCSQNLGITVSAPSKTEKGFYFEMDFIEQFKNETFCEGKNKTDYKLDLPPSRYTLNFEFENNMPVPDEKSLFILNKLDKSIEGII